MPEHLDVFRRFRERFGGGRLRRDPVEGAAGSQPFDPGRDPDSLSNAVAGLLRDRGWSASLAQSELLVGWAEAVGPSVSEHAEPVALEDGQLVIRCDSTAWAANLKLMSSQLLSRLAEQFPEAGVDRLRFLGPDVPSFKRGPRSVPGRGPRDTYG